MQRAVLRQRRRPRACRMRALPATEHGQAAVETMMVMLFVLLLVFGLAHITIFVVGRFTANYAAFAAARTAMIRGAASPYRYAAAVDVMRALPDSGLELLRRGQPLQMPLIREDARTRRGLVVLTRLQTGFPIYRSTPIGQGIEAFVPMIVQPPVPQRGDNAGQ